MFGDASGRDYFRRLNSLRSEEGDEVPASCGVCHSLRTKVCGMPLHKKYSHGLCGHLWEECLSRRDARRKEKSPVVCVFAPLREKYFSAKALFAQINVE